MKTPIVAFSVAEVARTVGQCEKTAMRRVRRARLEPDVILVAGQHKSLTGLYSLARLDAVLHAITTKPSPTR